MSYTFLIMASNLHMFFDSHFSQIQNYLQDILGDSSAVTAMAKEFRMLSKKRSNISSRIEQSKNVSEEPSTGMGMSTSVGFGEVNKKQQKNASGILGNEQIKFSKDDKNRGRSNQNRAAFATNSNTIDMKVLHCTVLYCILFCSLFEITAKL